MAFIGRALVGCEYSQIVTTALLSHGWDAYSCDLLPTEGRYPDRHFQCDVLDILDQDWTLGVFHPNCQFITNAGSRHLHSHVTSKNGIRAKIHGEERMQKMREACEFFNQLKNAPIPHICIENPIPHKYAKAIIGQYDKSTCLWLKNLPKLIPTNVVKEQMMLLPKKERCKIHYASPGLDRWKRRSKTYEGIAQAMAIQFSQYILNNQ